MAGIDNNTLLYLRGDSFVDLSLSPKTVTKQYVSLEKDDKFSYIDFAIQNSNDSVVRCRSDVFKTIGTGDFTVEFWINRTGGLSNAWRRYADLYEGDSQTTGRIIIREGETGYLQLGTTDQYLSTKSSDLNNKWTHIAVSRQNNTTKVFLNGKLTFTSTSDTHNFNYNDFRFGNRLGNTQQESFYGKMCHLRLSNIARYTKDFTPQVNPFNSISVNITNQTNDKIDFNIVKLGNETINRIEVLTNHQVSKTYTSIGNLTYNIDKSLLLNGNNKIKIKVTFDNDYTEEKEFNYEYKIDNLSTSSSLKELIDRQELLTNLIEVQKNNLKSILESKNVEVSEGENKLSILIDKVGLFDKYIPPILYVYNQGDSRVNFKSAIQSNFTGATFDFQKNNTNMVISTANSNSTGRIITGITESYIDVTNYSKINFEYEVFSSGTVNQFVFFSGNVLDWDLAKDYPFEVYNILENISVNVAKNGVATLNISNQTGNKGIGFRVLSKNATSCYCKITKIWLEK